MMGRPPGARNKVTRDIEKARQLELFQPLLDSKTILENVANWFYQQGSFLADHAAHLSEVGGTPNQISTLMEEAREVLMNAARVASMHAKATEGISGEATISFVARLPAPSQDSQQWAIDSNPLRGIEHEIQRPELRPDAKN